MEKLSHDEVLAIHGELVTAGLGEAREALLAGVSSGIRATIPVARTASEQILCDLTYMNELQLDQTQQQPLFQYLRNAVAVAPPEPSARLLREILTRYTGGYACHSRPRGGLFRRSTWTAIGVFTATVAVLASGLTVLNVPPPRTAGHSDD